MAALLYSTTAFVLLVELFSQSERRIAAAGAAGAAAAISGLLTARSSAERSFRPDADRSTCAICRNRSSSAAP